jgi:acetylornithine/succinyldiaminopimelate/putrescine aminotransferase
MMPPDLHRRFLKSIGQTSPFPNGLAPRQAQGCWIEDWSGRRYLDFISGIAVCNVGHCHPRVVEAVANQAQRYAHTMVYGEHVQDVQVELAEALTSRTPPGLDSAFLLTTGSEANDAALKMAARLTGRKKFVAYRGAYHGDTLGALACFGSEEFRRPHQNLLHRDVAFGRFNDFESLDLITEKTAGVLVEPVQGEGGIRVPDCEWLPALRERCNQTGAFLIFDEVQTGLGRLGAWFGAEWFRVIPDALTLAKGLGAGMPLAALVAPRDALYRFAADPPFSHITTFGGHPVCCAAALAGIHIIEEEDLLRNTQIRGRQLRDGLTELALNHKLIQAVRGVGLMIGFDLPHQDLARKVVDRCKEQGLIVETNLLSEHTIRLSPPLIVKPEECKLALDILGGILEGLSTEHSHPA